jgi:catechol 2,3-dioxygenase-like lactoylglutathione lyase family enzyme
MRIELDHIVLAVRRLDEMLGFYLDIVGLAPHRVDEFRAGTALFPCLRVSEGTIIDLLPEALWSAGADDLVQAGHPNLHHFCLCVERGEWQALLARREGGGVEIESGPMTLSGARGDGTSIYVRDPDGNRVELRHYD